MSARTDLVDRIAILICQCYGVGIIEDDTPGPHPECRRDARRVLDLVRKQLKEAGL